MYSTNEAKLLKSVHVVKFRLNGLNSDQIQTTIGQMVWIQTSSEKSDQSGNSAYDQNPTKPIAFLLFLNPFLNLFGPSNPQFKKVPKTNISKSMISFTSYLH